MTRGRAATGRALATRTLQIGAVRRAAFVGAAVIGLWAAPVRALLAQQTTASTGDTLQRADSRAVAAPASRDTVSPAMTATDSALARVHDLVAQGRTPLARAVVDSLLLATPPQSIAYASALYARASLATNADSAERDYRRITVEYSASPRASDALLRLAQLELARGNRDQAAAHLARLTRDQVPGQTGVAYARTQLQVGLAYFDLEDVTRACVALTAARSAAPASDVELRNRIDYNALRCPRTAPVPAPSKTPPPAAKTTAAPAAPSTAAASAPVTAPAKASAAPSAAAATTVAAGAGAAVASSGAATPADTTPALPGSAATAAPTAAAPTAAAPTAAAATAAAPTAAAQPAAAPTAAGSTAAASTAAASPAAASTAATPAKTTAVAAAPAAGAAPAKPAAPAPPAAASKATVAAPAAVPAAAATTDASRRVSGPQYSVQVAAYNTQSAAEALAANLKGRGYPVRVFGQAPPFRVRIGRYPTESAAESEAAALKAKGIVGFVTTAEPLTP